MIHYIQGDATYPTGDGPKVIVHVVNDIGKWGRGFVLAVSKRWPMAEAEYRRWFKGDPLHPTGPRLGAVQFVEVEADLWVANLIGQRGIRVVGGVAPIRYSSIGEGLEQVAAFARERDASIHMPRIGAGLAGGQWPRIAYIINDRLAGLDVTIYSLPEVVVHLP